MKQASLKRKLKHKVSKRFSKSDIPANTLKKKKAIVIREKRVRFGLKKYLDPNQKTVINKERFITKNGKKLKEIKFKTIQRKEIEPSNKLPIQSSVTKRRMSRSFQGMRGNRC